MLRPAWRQLKDFSALGGDATYLWPRWLVLRGVGLIFILIFAGVSDVSQVLVGPRGLVPLAGFFAELRQTQPNALEAFLRPIRERRGELAAKPARVREIIMEGTRKGRAVAQSTMDEVRAAMKLDYKLGG